MSGDVSICDLVTNESKEWFLQEVMRLPETQDPILQPTFGNPNSVTAQIQQEVFSIISTYQGLLANNFVGAAAIPIVPPAVIPLAFMWHFHYAQMAIVGTIQRLANPGPGPNTNTIDGLPAGAFICDLSIIYSNTVFVVHISKT